jgi:hypothetical protein
MAQVSDWRTAIPAAQMPSRHRIWKSRQLAQSARRTGSSHKIKTLPAWQTVLIDGTFEDRHPDV